MNECHNGEFNILGYKVRFRPDTESSRFPAGISASDIVKIVEDEATKIREVALGLDNGKIAVLVALKMATEKFALEKEYQDSIESLQKTAMNALQFIEEVTPTSV